MVGMLIAFIVLLGIMLLFRVAVSCNMGEALLLAFILVVLTVVGSSCLGIDSVGKFCLMALGGIGWIAAVIGLFLHRIKIEEVLSPYMFGLVFLFLAGLLLFRVGRLHLEEEFSVYAYQVQNVYKGKHLDFMDLNGMTFYLLYFVRFAGYQDRVLYMSMFFLTASGFLLPLQKTDWKRGAGALLYIVLLFVSTYTLFSQGLYHLYPELPLAALAGGLCCLWKQEKVWNRNRFLVLAGSAFLLFFRPETGWIAGIVVLGVILSDIMAGCRNRKLLYILGVLWLIALALLFLFGVYQMPKDRIAHFVYALFGNYLGPKSKIGLGVVPAMLAIGILRESISLFNNDTKQSHIDIIGMGVTVITLLLAIFLVRGMGSSLSDQEYAEVERLFAIPVIAYFMILIWQYSNLGYALSGKQKAISTYVCLFIMVFFMRGWNENMLAYCTSWDQQKRENSGATKQLEKTYSAVKDMADSKEKILIMNQSKSDHLSLAMGKYYLGKQASDWQKEPWMITDSKYYVGTKTKTLETEEDYYSLFIRDYDYLVIGNSDKYIEKYVKKLVDEEKLYQTDVDSIYKVCK